MTLYWSGWLELAIAGLMTAVGASLRLSVTQGPALCATALASASAGRAAILRSTCASSDSGWARLVRAALLETASDLTSAGAPGSYRDAPQRTTSEAVTRLFSSELSRIARTRAIGLSGAALGLLCAAVLIPAQGVVIGLLMLATLAACWRVVVNGRRSAAALDEARRALRDIVAVLPPPPPRPSLDGQAPSRVHVRSSLGLLDGFFVVGFGLMLAIIVAALISELRHRVPASQIGLLFGMHFMLVAFLLMLSFLLVRVVATVESANGELELVRSVLGITYARTTVPLEIVGSFFVEGRRTTYLAADLRHHDRPRRRAAAEPTSEQRILIADGDLAEAAAATLNEALGCEPRSPRP